MGVQRKGTPCQDGRCRCTELHAPSTASDAYATKLLDTRRTLTISIITSTGLQCL